MGWFNFDKNKGDSWRRRSPTVLRSHSVILNHISCPLPLKSFFLLCFIKFNNCCCLLSESGDWDKMDKPLHPILALNTQIIFFLNVFSDGHEAATKDGDHRPFVREHPFCLFEQIPSKYKYTGNYCWQSKYPGI